MAVRRFVLDQRASRGTSSCFAAAIARGFERKSERRTFAYACESMKVFTAAASAFITSTR